MFIPLTGIMLITAGFCGIIAIISYYIKRPHFHRAAKNFPGPLALPVFGNALSFMGNTINIVNKSNALSERYQSPFRLWLGSKLYFVLYDADHVKTILLSNNAIEKDEVYKFMYPWVGTGLITAPAAKSKIHRKLIIPIFNQKIFDSFIEIFNEQSLILTKQMRREMGKGEFDILDYVSLCTLDIICETTMGVTMNAQAGVAKKYINAAKREIEIIFLRIFRYWLHYDFIFNLSKLGKDQRECLKYLHSVTNDVIHKKRVLTQEPKKKFKALLDLMMELSNDGKKLTDEELREEIDTMIIAGNDTTATVDSFALMMLANFPEIQDKVYQELCAIYGDEISSDAPVDKEDLDHMVYLERVIKEAMRLFPPSQLLTRALTEDIQIDGKTLPKGSSVALAIFKLHRSEKYWPDPLKFDPDRFLPEKVSERHPYCYVPFGGGPRGCIGQKYAFMALKIILATVLRRYIFIKDKPVKIQDMKLKADITLKPAVPLHLRILKRTVEQKHQSTSKKK